MKKEVWVISLGGSRIAPSSKGVDYKFIKDFEDLVKRHPSKKFVVVTGGGNTAREYISALRNLNAGKREQSEAGISVTRFHASFLSRIFGKIANSPIPPKNLKEVSALLAKNQVVFCGALRWEKNKTSDGTAADIASYLKSSFINLTNVRGLYTSNPKTNKNAKFVKKITWNKFNERVKKIKFKAGQHFVLDQNASKTILKNKIKTYIIGSLSDLESIITGKRFKGTLISD